jgi:hypothetical protein
MRAKGNAQRTEPGLLGTVSIGFRRAENIATRAG